MLNSALDTEIPPPVFPEIVDCETFAVPPDTDTPTPVFFETVDCKRLSVPPPTASIPIAPDVDTVARVSDTAIVFPAGIEMPIPTPTPRALLIPKSKISSSPEPIAVRITPAFARDSVAPGSARNVTL